MVKDFYKVQSYKFLSEALTKWCFYKLALLYSAKIDKEESA